MAVPRSAQNEKALENRPFRGLQSLGRGSRRNADRGGSGPRTGGRSKRAHGVAFGVQSSSLAIGEPNGLRTVAALLKAGTDLEVEAPMDEDEGDFGPLHSGMP
jgi:hypothetical protein